MTLPTSRASAYSDKRARTNHAACRSRACDAALAKKLDIVFVIVCDSLGRYGPIAPDRRPPRLQPARCTGICTGMTLTLFARVKQSRSTGWTFGMGAKPQPERDMRLCDISWGFCSIYYSASRRVSPPQTAHSRPRFLWDRVGGPGLADPKAHRSSTYCSTCYTHVYPRHPSATSCLAVLVGASWL